MDYELPKILEVAQSAIRDVTIGLVIWGAYKGISKKFWEKMEQAMKKAEEKEDEEKLRGLARMLVENEGVDISSRKSALRDSESFLRSYLIRHSRSELMEKIKKYRDEYRVENLTQKCQKFQDCSPNKFY